MTSKAARLIYSHRQAFRDEDEAPQPSSEPPRAGTKRRRTKRLPRTHRTLAVLLESLRDDELVFELKNDTEVSGLLYDVDANLNVNLVDAEVTPPNGPTRRLETMYLNGTLIRYVRLPDKVDAIQALDRYLDARARITRTETRQKRAEPASRPAAPPPIHLPPPEPSR